MIRSNAAACLLALALTGPAAANPDETAIRKAIASLVPDAVIDSVAATPWPGLYEIAVGGQVLYVSGDGRYLFQGTVFDIENKVDLTERSRNRTRKDALAALPAEKRIRFAPEDIKHEVTVFTAIDCGYCRRLHQDMAAYNAHGIAVDYVFMPRGDTSSESYRKAVDVWCAPDRQAAMTTAKAGGELPRQSCDNPVEETWRLGQALGVTGTPAIVMADGSLILSYLPAEELLTRLDGARSAGLSASN